MQRAVERAAAQFGGLDLVVANAGIGTVGTVRATDPAVFDRVIEVNVLGVHRTILAALPQIIARGGHVLVVASMYAYANGMLRCRVRLLEGGRRAPRPVAARRTR